MQSIADLAKAVGQLPAPVRRVFDVRRDPDVELPSPMRFERDSPCSI